MFLIKPPFTRKQLEAMNSRDYDFAWKRYRNQVEAALAAPLPPPTPPPPLFPRSDIKKIAIAEEMASEYLAFAKGHVLGDGTIPEFVWDAFLKSKNEAAQLKDAEAEVEKWLASHPEFIISESNRKTVWDYLSENDLKVSGENLEKAFTAVRSSLTLDETKLPYDLNEPDTRVGSYTNGVFRPYDPGHSQNTIKAPLGLGQHVPGSSDDVIIKKDHRKMSSGEYAEALRISSSFREKMNKS